MRKLLITLLLSIISSHTIAAVGDVYNCQELSKVYSRAGGGVMDGNKSLSNFAFKREKNKISFEYLPSLTVTSSNKEEFTAFNKDKSGTYDYLTFKNGMYASTSNTFQYGADTLLVMSIIAKCKVSKLY